MACDIVAVMESEVMSCVVEVIGYICGGLMLNCCCNVGWWRVIA